MSTEIEDQGMFGSMLTKTNKERREASAGMLKSSVIIFAKRTLDDYRLKVSNLNLEIQEHMNITGGDIMTVNPVRSNFDQETFFKTIVELEVELLEAEVSLSIAESQYKKLFGKA